MRIICSILSVVFVFSSASQAAAEERWPRWYLGLSAGVAMVEESDLSGAINGDVDYDTGAHLSGAIGYMPFFNQAYLDNIRTEVELGWRQAGLDGFTNGGAPGATNDKLSIVSTMGNILYDFDNDSRWTPYVGAGAGVANIELSKNSGLGNTDDEDTVFAYQFLAGLTYSPTSIPLTEWGLGYRYFGANSPEFPTAGAALDFDDISSHSIEANARFRF